MAKVARIDLRLDAMNKALLERAAALLDTSLSDFTTGAALDKARAVVAEHERLYVSHQAFDHLLSELERPARALPALAQQLKKAR